MRQTKLVLYFANNETGELETEIKVVDANTLIKNPEKQIMEAPSVERHQGERCN